MQQNILVNCKLKLCHCAILQALFQKAVTYQYATIILTQSNCEHIISD